MKPDLVAVYYFLCTVYAITICLILSYTLNRVRDVAFVLSSEHMEKCKHNTLNKPHVSLEQKPCSTSHGYKCNIRILELEG